MKGGQCVEVHNDNECDDGEEKERMTRTKMWHDIEKGSVNRALSSYKNGHTFVLENKNSKAKNEIV